MIHIILNKPQLAENTGMAMRAMANTGIKNLRIVSPIHEWPSKKASFSSAEKDHILNIKVFDTFDDAISDLHMVFATSARRRNMIKKIYTPRSAVKKIYQNNKLNIGIVFGNEKFGLTNEEMSLCNFVVEIPSIDFSSYNLAQSVLILCYQMMSVKSFDKEEIYMGKTEIASQNQVDFFLKKLEIALLRRSHFSSDKKHILMMQTIRNLFKRSILTSQEIQSMLGVIDTLVNK